MLGARPASLLLGLALGALLGTLVVLAHEAAHYVAFLALGVAPHALVVWPPGVSLPTDAVAAMAPGDRAFATLVGPVLGMLACVGLFLLLRAALPATVAGVAARIPSALLLLAQALLTLDPRDPRNDGGVAAQDVGALPVTALAALGSLVGAPLLAWALAELRRAWSAERSGAARARRRGTFP